MKEILCYGDSNTWGHTPVTGCRYSRDVRWPGVAQKLLGSDYFIHENGIGGRTSIYDDPLVPCKNGLKSLDYALLSSRPLDMVVLCLGTNDMKITNVQGSRKGNETLIREILSANERFHTHEPIFPNGVRILLLAPIHIHPAIEVINPGAQFSSNAANETKLFAQQFEALAAAYSEVSFLDASLYAFPSEEDGVHMNEKSHQRLGTAVADKIRQIFEV